MNICRFEDRLSGQARVLKGFRERITACRQEDLPQAFARIEAARQRGDWIALLLDFELGEWFEPVLHRPAPGTPGLPASAPRLTALVYEEMALERPWPEDPASDARVLALAPEISRDDYLKRIEQIREWIGQGDIYQINSTFPMQVSIRGDALPLYQNLANRHPVAYAAYIEDEGRTVLSFSPELFLQRQGRTLTTKPMKGTAPRSQNPEQDRQLGENLLRSQKNRAENLMIVDLLRNDLGRVAKPGSVVAAPLFSLEQYPSVWTMTSTVTAELLPEVGFETILRALFPCGSVTGAPKIEAMKRIQQTEPAARGLYCGSIGWMAPNGDFSLNVAIRTLVLQQQRATYHVGGGIVYDSEPAQEWEECHWKSRVLVSDMPELIETMLANPQGRIDRIEEHLNRLQSSALQLNYACPSRDVLQSKIQNCIDQARLASQQQNAPSESDFRVRLLLKRDGNLSLQAAPLPKLVTVPFVGIAPLLLDSGQALLGHKTTYRPWYASATDWLATYTDYFDLLFLNEKGELCEGSRSNIYIEKNGEWVTPARACGLLGGVVRQHLLATRQAREGLLTREDLEKPDARIRLSNGLRGWFDVRYRATSLLPGDFLP